MQVNNVFLTYFVKLTSFLFPRPIIAGGRDENKGEKRQQEIEECATALVVLKLLSSHLSSQLIHIKFSTLDRYTCQTGHILFTRRLTFIVHRVELGWSKLKVVVTVVINQ